MDIRTKDGIVLRGIPDGTPESAIKERIAKIRSERGLAAPAAAPVAQPTAEPEQNLWQKARPYVAPVVEGLGSIAGGLAGAALGVPASPSLAANPVTLGVAGSALGYAGGRQLMELGDVYLGGEKPKTAGEVAGEAAKDVLVGAALESGGRVVLGSAAKAAGWAWDVGSKKLIQTKGGKVVREIAGDQLPQLKAALAATPAGDTRTVGQIAKDAGITSPPLQALEKRAAKELPTEFRVRSDVQEAGRISSLAGVTPDKSTAEGLRKMVSDILYGRADKAKLPPLAQAVDAQGASLLKRPDIQDAVAVAERNAANRGISLYDSAGNLTGRGAHAIKVALDDAARSTGVTAGKKDAGAAIGNARDEFVSWIEKAVPVYGQARRAHATFSAPVNQSTVLNEMTSVLNKPTGGERVTPFLNVLGRGEQALLKRSTGQPRYTELNQVLNPQQMGVVDDVANQLRRDAAMASEAQTGDVVVNKMLGQLKEPIQAPSLLSATISMANSAARLLQGKVSEKTIKRVSKAMLDGQDMLTLLNSVPAAERIAVLRAMQNMKKVPGGTLAAQNMLGVDESVNRELIQ